MDFLVPTNWQKEERVWLSRNARESDLGLTETPDQANDLPGVQEVNLSACLPADKKLRIITYRKRPESLDS